MQKRELGDAEVSAIGLGGMLDAGTIRMAGISNANADQIRRAQQVLDGRLTSVQNQFSPSFRSSESELALCDELGNAFLPWSPLGGIGSASRLGQEQSAFGRVAGEHSVSAQQICLAWMLAKSQRVLPIPGASLPGSISDSARAADLQLTAEELAELDAG